MLNKIFSFFARSKIKKPESVKLAFGIPMTDEEIEQDRQANEEIIRLLEETLANSGFFKPEKLTDLIENIGANYIPFSRRTTKIVFDNDDYLTVEEKRSLDLNTRMKYSRKFIDCFEPSAFKTIEPKGFVECAHLDAFHRVSRKKELIKMKNLGFVEKIKIVPDHECQKIKRFKKIHNIEDVPELPLNGCDMPFCRCYYQPVISNSR